MPSLRTARAFITLIFFAMAVGLAAAPAQAAKDTLWATVNICDTPTNPDTIGLRASMPGNGSKKTRMYMRFRVEYFVARDQTWKPVRKGGDSGWVSVGTGKFVARQSGRSFEFSPAAGNILLRGRVSFEWRRGTRVIRRAVRRTEAGHVSSAGADPEGFSSAECLIKK
ncbi:MAG: hypothetical protein JHC95_17480 [Solirubrobacteraceae bacterium]|nr:hypothetical protein [Solirubrobacteraceae bacterium]